MKNLIFRFRKRKKVKPYKVDTSQKGFEYVGIKLTDEQFQDMCNLNLLWANDRKDIPVFNMLVLMKVLGLLPSEMIRDNESDDSGDDIYERKFGKIRRWANQTIPDISQGRNLRSDRRNGRKRWNRKEYTEINMRGEMRKYGRRREKERNA